MAGRWDIEYIEKPRTGKNAEPLITHLNFCYLMSVYGKHPKEYNALIDTLERVKEEYDKPSTQQSQPIQNSERIK